MEFNIYYNHDGVHGEMTIYLEPFLQTKDLTRFRKLLKIIRTSETPECEQYIRDYIYNYTETQYYNDKWNLQKKLARCEDHVQCGEIDVCDIQKELEEQAESAEELKEARQELKRVKRQLKDDKQRFIKYQHELKNTESYKAFLDKCYNILGR